MSKKELERKLKQLDTEDFIWLIYIGIIFMSWLSNHYERDYFINNNLQSKKEYRKIMIIIFSILIIVYIYFLKDSLEDLKSLKPTTDNKTKSLTTLSFIGSLLIAISGAIFLYIAIKDEELNVEIAFN
ncbi:MAG: hypothetical protein ACI4XM_07710 [Candidatus Coprovivens sp.]